MLPLELQCLAHRYLYYVLARPIVSDYAYDSMEYRVLGDPALAEDSPMRKPGSDRADDYPLEAVTLAMRMLNP